MYKLVGIILVLLIINSFGQPPIVQNDKKWIRRYVDQTLAMGYVKQKVGMSVWYGKGFLLMLLKSINY